MKNGAWKEWATSLKNNVYALYLASRHDRVPITAKIIIGSVLAYALSPIDLIPDFIPLIGYLDDLVLLPLGIWLSIRLVPREVWQECQALAVKREFEMPHSYRAAVVIVILWLLAIAGFMLWVWQFVGGIEST